MIDAEAGTLLLGKKTVILRGGRIHSISPSSAQVDPELKEAREIDLEGAYLCPYVPR